MIFRRFNILIEQENKRTTSRSGYERDEIEVELFGVIHRIYRRNGIDFNKQN
jgi:hypothetical protein